MTIALADLRSYARVFSCTAVLALAVTLTACSTATPRSQAPTTAPVGSESAPMPQSPSRTPGGQIAPTSDTRAAIAAYALQQLDAPYQANAVGPASFDSSGLVYYAYRRAGASLARETQGQLDAGKPIDLAEAQPSDLLFFRVDDAAGNDRVVVGMYTDTGEMLMAVPDINGESGVSLLDLDDEFWAQRLVGVIRALNP